MMKYFIGVFYILHGLVHLLYMGHSLRLFELEEGFIWPDNSKLLSGIVSLNAKKRLAATLCVIAAISFIISGIFLFSGHPWHKTVALLAVITSSILFVTFWDGSWKKLNTQGGIALLINILIIIYSFL